VKQAGWGVPVLYGAIAAGAAILTLSGLLWLQTSRLDRCVEAKAKVAAEFEVFVQEAKRLGEAAQREAHAEMLRDKMWKELNDAKNTADMAALRAERDRLRRDRAGARGGVVPPAPAGTRDPATACFDRPQLERAIRDFEAGVEGLIEQGDEARVGLDGAKRWAQKR
jgi:hypothetical protein